MRSNFVVASGLLRLAAVVLLAGVPLTALAGDDSSLLAFVSCRAPFHPTQRLHDLIGAAVIEPTPAAHVDGIPHFRVTGTRQVFGLRVIAVAGFDGSHWDNGLYVRTPGTPPPPHVALLVVSAERETRLALPEAERGVFHLSGANDPIVAEVVEALLSQKPPMHDELSGARITEITCLGPSIAGRSSGKAAEPAGEPKATTARSSKIAFSQRLGVEVFAEDGSAGWCRPGLQLRVRARDAAFFESAELQNLMWQVAGQVLAKQCAVAERVRVTGHVQVEGAPVYAGMATRGDGWTVVRGAPPPASAAGVAEAALPARADAGLPAELIAAVQRGDLATVDRLVAQGVDVDARNAQGDTALMLGAVNGHAGVVRSLLRGAAAVNARRPDGVTALMQAAWKGQNAVAQVLLEHGAVVDARDSAGRTALVWGSVTGQAAVVQTLLGSGAAVAARTNEGWTPLMAAAVTGRDAVVETLLTSGAAADPRDNQGTTPLIGASALGHAAVVRTLLAHGADVNAANTNGETALIAASQGGHLPVVTALLAHGPNTRATTRGGETASRLAAQANHTAVAQALRAAAARGLPPDTVAEPTARGPDPGAGKGNGATVDGIVKAVEPQGMNYLEVTVVTDDRSERTVQCHGGMRSSRLVTTPSGVVEDPNRGTRVFRNGREVEWLELKPGRQIRATGTWLREEGAVLLYADRIELLDGGQARAGGLSQAGGGKASAVDTGAFVGTWRYHDPSYAPNATNYLKISPAGSGRFKLVEGYQDQHTAPYADRDGIYWTPAEIRKADGIYLRPVNRQLQGEFVSPNFRATHGRDMTYRMTLDLRPDGRLQYAVWSSIRGETETLEASRVVAAGSTH